MQINNTKETGNKGEDLACQFLINLGYKILERNWFNREGKMLGEIDIIAKNKFDDIVFIEVKTREIFSNNLEEIHPEEQITPQKIKKMQKIAEDYICKNNLWEKNWQFDAVSVIFSFNQKTKIIHLENIFF